MSRKQTSDWQLLRRFIGFLGPLRWPLIGVCLIYLTNAMLNLVPAVSLQWLIDGIIAGESVEILGQFNVDGGSWFPDAESKMRGIIYFGLIILTGILVANAVGVWQWRASTRVTQRLLLDIKRRVHLHLHKLSLGYFERERTGAIMSRCVSDIEQMDQMLKNFFHLFYSTIHLISVPA
ncbi:MAG: ABC transporter transmembrane domain-containing protein, partial [Planctomycetota bacterium]